MRPKLMVDGGEVLVASWYFVIYFLPTNNKFQAVHQYSNILLGLLGQLTNWDQLTGASALPRDVKGVL